MTAFKNYEKYDGLGLADLVRKKEVSSLELVESAIDIIEKRNPKLNCVVQFFYDEAKAKAKVVTPDSPFSGVPFLIKDLLAVMKDKPLTMGSKAYKKYIPKQDSEMVRRFHQAGLITVGKTNTPEFGLVGFTEPELYGPCRNPWNTDHTPGGSSGGAAAAVAAGMVPIASGGDGGGSIRIPASACGLFGIKPTRGRNPLGPYYGQVWKGAVVEFVISRSVRDSAALLDCTQGNDPGAPYEIPPPARPYLSEVGRNPGKLKIGFCTDSPIGLEVHEDCKAAVKKAASLLEGLGHTVEEKPTKVDGKALALAYITNVLAEVAADLEELDQLMGKGSSKNVELTTQTLGLLGKTVSAKDLTLALREWEKAGRLMAEYFQTHDLYLTPTMARPPVKIGELALNSFERVGASIMNSLQAGKLLQSIGLVEQLAFQNLAPMPFTQLGNVTGLPSMSLPLHWNSQNLPIGVMLTGPFGREDRLFQIASQLEEAAPWFDKRPSQK